MIEVEMNKDIRDCEQKLIGPFTKRQLVCVLVGIGYGVPIFLLLGKMDVSAKILITMLLMSPAFLCGWIKLYGLPLERFGIHIIKSKILTPTRRVSGSSNWYAHMKDELDAEEEMKKMQQNGKKRADAPKVEKIKIKDLPADCRFID